MKKIFTLVSGLLLAVAVMAADRRPVVTVSSLKNYKIVIDGKAYFSNSSDLRIANMRGGHHSIQVFEMKRGYFERRERMVASTSFRLTGQDISIRIGYFGNISIREINRHGRFDRFDRDDDRDNDWDRDKKRDRRHDDNRQF